MVSKYILDEIIKLPSDNSISLMETLKVLKNFNISLSLNKKTYDTEYKVRLIDILESNLENESLLKLRNGGWEYDEKEEYLIKNMNKK